MRIQCKRVYFPAEKTMVIGYWLTGYGREALKKQRWSMMNGIRPLRPPPNCAKPFIAN